MTKPDIHHRTVGGQRHPGRAEYCHTCTPPPAPTAVPVVPATRRGDYRPPVITSELATRDTLVALTDAGPNTAPPVDAPGIPDPPRGTVVLVPTTLAHRVWAVGVVETTGYAGTVVAYVHPADLARAREGGYPPDVRRVRCRVFHPAPAAALAATGGA